MERVTLDGIPTEYELSGEGEPVLLCHARPFVTWYEPLVGALAQHRVLRYRREPSDESFGIEDDAALCARLLELLDIDRPHVVGHSYGGLVALELARQARVAPRTLALLEPATSGLLDPGEAAAGMAPLLTVARTEGPAVAMELFLRSVCGPDGPEVLDGLVPGALGEALTHAAAFFAVELPAVIRWSLGPSAASGIDIPILNLVGTDSTPRFADGAQIIASWFPAAEHRVLPRANHLMMAQQPAATAELLEEFWRRR